MKTMTVGTKLHMTFPELMRAGDYAHQAPLTRALRKYVKGLPDRQLYALLAMLYAGRDGKADPVAYWHTSIKSTVESRSAAIEVVLEKSLAEMYIQRAVEALPPGLALDSIPALIAGAL